MNRFHLVTTAFAAGIVLTRGNWGTEPPFSVLESLEPVDELRSSKLWPVVSKHVAALGMPVGTKTWILFP
jgi:hypothetical protein